MTRYISSIAILLFGTLSLTAQSDLSAFFLQNDWRAAYTNPAMVPGGLTVALPGVYNNLLITNVTYNDLVTTNDVGQMVIDVDRAINQLQDRNVLRENLDIETIGLGVSFGKLTLSLGHRMRYQAFMDYPKTLPQLIWQGNAQFIGQAVDFSTDLDLLGYHELSLGAMFSVTDKIRIGGRAKLLNGIGSSVTERNQLILETDDEIYELTLDADLLINNSGALNYNSLEDITLDFSFGEFNTSDFFSRNSGMAFDVGVVFDLGNLEISASALDLGASIDWDTNVRNYSLQGRSEFQGLDAAQALFDDETEFGDILDTLSQLYEPTETNVAYSTPIASAYYLGANYELSEALRVGAVLFMEDYRDQQHTDIALHGSYQLASWLRLGALYALRNERADNLGLNAQLAFGPARLLLATDNAITAFRPKDSYQANFRVGLALQFGGKEQSTAEPASLY